MRSVAFDSPRDGTIHLLYPETEVERAIGASRGLPRPYAGVLFSFSPPVLATMTMEKTPMALQIAFVGPDRVVYSVYDAPARSGLYTGHKPTRWVIETFLMWHVLRVGDRLVLPP